MSESSSPLKKVFGFLKGTEGETSRLPNLENAAHEKGLGDFATAIMTTDLVPKVRTIAIEEKSGPAFRITGLSHTFRDGRVALDAVSFEVA